MIQMTQSGSKIGLAVVNEVRSGPIVIECDFDLVASAEATCTGDNPLGRWRTGSLYSEYSKLQ